MKDRILEIASSIEFNKNELAELCVYEHYKIEGEKYEKYGEKGKRHAKEDALYFIDYLLASLKADKPEIFADFLSWGKVFFKSISLPDTMIGVLLNLMKKTFSGKLSPEDSELINNHIDIAVELSKNSPENIEPFIHDNTKLGVLAFQYLNSLLRADRHFANDLIMKEVKKGTPIKDIYLFVFQPVQYEIGRLWQENKISVAKEHYATAATQMIMSRLYPYIFSNNKNGKKLLSTCVSGDLHEIGIRMVSDFFEMEGWDTYFLGGNTPEKDLIKAAEEFKPDIIAISATLTLNIENVKNIIREIKNNSTLSNAKIMVGGYPFNKNPGLWKEIGADAFSTDAENAIKVSNTLLN